MINIFVNKSFEEMIGKFSEKDKEIINKSLNKIIHGKKPILKRIPSSDLYAKKINGVVLIFSKKAGLKMPRFWT